MANFMQGNGICVVSYLGAGRLVTFDLLVLDRSSYLFHSRMRSKPAGTVYAKQYKG
jgi:hypothetical protein